MEVKKLETEAEQMAFMLYDSLKHLLLHHAKMSIETELGKESLEVKAARYAIARYNFEHKQKLQKDGPNERSQNNPLRTSNH